MRSKKTGIGIVAMIVVLCGIAAFLVLTIRQNSGPIPQKYTDGLTITLYYPTRLPAGYTVDRNSFERQEDTLIFSIASPKGRNVSVSQQAAPADVPTRTTTATPVPIALPGERNFYTTAGQAHIGLWGDKYVSDIITPNGTWIVLNVTGFSADEATAVSKSFTKL